jgi:hypothetical protein
MTVAELNARMSSAELSEWQAYLRVEREDGDERRQQAELEARAGAGVEARRVRMKKGR